jgi:hypothetical protein
MVSASLFIGVVSTAEAEDIVIDTEKGFPGFRTEPARGLPANWQYVHDHPDISVDGWFDTKAYPPGQGRATAPSGTPSHSLTWANVKVSGRLQCHILANTKSLRGSPALTLLTFILMKIHRQVTTCQRNERSTKSFIMRVWLP